MMQFMLSLLSLYVSAWLLLSDYFLFYGNAFVFVTPLLHTTKQSNKKNNISAWWLHKMKRNNSFDIDDYEFNQESNQINDKQKHNDNNNVDYDDYTSTSTTSSSNTIKQRRRGPIRRATPSATVTQIQKRQQDAKKRHAEALKDPTLLTNVQFAQRSDINSNTKRAITEVMGLTSMTEIQAKTYAAALNGESVLGRAKTGTGKTLAFLLPSIERLLESDLSLYKPGQDIGILIVAPTRELAIQIAQQASDAVTFHKDLDVICLYGGTKMQRDMRLLLGGNANNNKGIKLPAILVATPGRLLDHIDSTRLRGRKFSDILSSTQIVVLDETDRLFEGFSKEVKKILSILPRKRQTLLFSATVPKRLRTFLSESLKIDYTQVDCIQSLDIRHETNLRVEQSYFVLDTMDHYISGLVIIILNAIQQQILLQQNGNGGNYKIVVFFPASKVVRFFADLFNHALDIPVLEMHSRITQSARNRASKAFRNAKNGILFTSDVSARGVDYPDITLVVQYGSPTTENSYIHRLGRTGRAGQQGKGLLVLLPFETNKIPGLTRRGVVQDETHANFVSNDTIPIHQQVQEMLQPVKLQIRSGHVILTPSAEAAYRSLLAYYIGTTTTNNNNNKNKGMTAKQILDYMNAFAYCTGLATIPPLEEKLAGKLQLDGLVETM